MYSVSGVISLTDFCIVVSCLIVKVAGMCGGVMCDLVLFVLLFEVVVLFFLCVVLLILVLLVFLFVRCFVFVCLLWLLNVFLFVLVSCFFGGLLVV